MTSPSQITVRTPLVLARCRTASKARDKPDRVVTGDQFLDWGWRVPFWLSIVMVGIGLYIRLGILETPAFLMSEQRCADRARDKPDPVATRDHFLGCGRR